MVQQQTSNPPLDGFAVANGVSGLSEMEGKVARQRRGDWAAYEFQHPESSAFNDCLRILSSAKGR